MTPGVKMMTGNLDKNTTGCCLICSNRIGNSSSIQIFDENSQTKPLADTISTVLGEDITVENSHSDLLCRKCYQLFDEFKSLEQRLSEIKQEISSNYKITVEKLNDESLRIEEECNDHDYIDNNMEYQIDEDRKTEYIEEERIDEETIGEFSPVNQDNNEDVDEEVPEEEEHIKDVEYLNEDYHDDDDDDDDDETSGIIVHIIENPDESSNNSFILPDTNQTVGQINVVETAKLLKNNPKKKREIRKKVTPLVEHVQEPIISKNEVDYDCLLCPSDKEKFTANTKDIIIHMRDVHEARIYICDVCGIDFRKRNELNSHMDGHIEHEKGDYQCDICNRIFESLRLYRIHKRSHNPQTKSWGCNQCDKRFGSKNLLTEHMNTHIGKRPYKCDTCHKDFASKYTFRAHSKTHEIRARPFECHKCNKTFLSQQNLNQHEKTHLGVKDFICKECDKAFGSAHNLEVHTIVHSGHKPYKCKLCHKAFARKAEIRDHERTHTGERPYQCEICGATFSQRSNLQSHKRATHYNDTRYTCDDCGKGFKRRRLLDYHIKAAHTGERPYKCDVCDATFVYPEHWKKHQRIHTGEKPYACEYCLKRFNSRDNRNAHRFIHSSKKPYECSICGHGFMRKPQLEQHMKDEKHFSDKIIMNSPHFPSTGNQEIILPEDVEYCSDDESEIISGEQYYKLEVINDPDNIYETEDGFISMSSDQHIIVDNPEISFGNVIETKPQIDTTAIFNYQATEITENQNDEDCETIISVPTTNELKNILVDEKNHVHLVKINVQANENNCWVPLVREET